MKKIEIYLKDEIVLSIHVEDYEISTYTNAIEISCHVGKIESTYSVPLNEGYKLIVEA